ncbi:MAG: DEAD/DEAH box helicase [Lentisphaerae bacterium]|nr:DEAD/DEAH box helicase [Lentisphaerota bacterium]
MASFEERLLAISGAEELKHAKALLKQHALAGAWRDADGNVCGFFRESSGITAEVSVTTGTAAVSHCTLCPDGKVCAHGVALLMYGGRFHAFDRTEEAPPEYSKALLRQDLYTLAGRGMVNTAQLRITAADDFLHAPSKYESLLLSVKLITPQREYTGNLANLRQLYFEKTLSVVVKFDNFPLHDQQIIRFLALNGEAVNSNISLNAELTSELFHALPGFTRFFHSGKRIIIRPERATPILVETGSKLLPGIKIGDAAMPFSGARLITGRAGFWIGKNDEYFFIGGECEAGFMRSFFRAAAHERNSITAFPLPILKSGALTPETLPAEIHLDGGFDAAGNFCLIPEYSYRVDGTRVTLPPRSSRIITAGRNCCRRDSAGEWEFENSLAMFGFELDDHCRVTETDVEKAGLFLDRVLPEIFKKPQALSLSARLAALVNGDGGVPEITLHCRLLEKKADSFLLGFELAGRGGVVDWETICLRAREKRSFVRTGSRIFRISPELGCFMRAAGVMLREIDPAGRTFEVPFCNAAYFRETARNIPGAVPVEMFGDDIGAVPVNLEKTFRFKGELRSYQQQGVAFMQYLCDRNFNALLADEMGLGKTVQLLALLASRMTVGGKPSLIVCPASLTVNWEREARRFVPAMRVISPQGAERNEVLKHPESFDLLILSYTGARMSRELLRKYKFDFLVLDEAQHIKNPGSENAKNCKSITAGHRIVLSGTPLENSPDDLWSVMDFLQPGMLGTLPSFRRRYAGIANDPELQHDLVCRTAPFIKRRTKKEVAADLPVKSELTLYCDPAPEQKLLYTELLEAGRNTIKSGSSADIFSLLLRLRQVCCHPALLPDGTGSNIPSGKTELLFELLHETIDSGHKVLLFSQFTSMLQLLIPELEKNGINFEYLDGSTRDRQQRVDRFNNDPGIPLFLLSLKAGGTGLNLTSADTVIIYDPWWNPAVELQAADRTHRIGQTRPVSTVKLVMRNSVEEKVLNLQEKKRKLFNALVENPAAGGGLSLDDLRALFD